MAEVFRVTSKLRRHARSAGRASLLIASLPLAACSSTSGFDPEKSLNPSNWFKGEKYEAKVIPDVPADDIYNQGLVRLQKKDYEAAGKKFADLEKQYPYSQWQKKGLLMNAFSQYQNGSYDDAISSAQRYYTLYPNAPDTPYAYYLAAMSNYNQIPDVSRDQERAQKAAALFQQIAEKFPKSEYAEDAKYKYQVCRDQLAGKEMYVGRYYLNIHNYIAAVNRFREVLAKYQTTRHAEEALMRLTEAYLALGITNEAQTAAAVLGHNFPDSQWYKDAYALLNDKGLKPQEEKGSWIAQLFPKEWLSAGRGSKQAEKPVLPAGPEPKIVPAKLNAGLPTVAPQPVEAPNAQPEEKEKDSWFSHLFPKSDVPPPPEAKPPVIESPAVPQAQADVPAQSRAGHTVAALPTPAPNPVPALSGDQPPKEGNWFSQLFQKSAEAPAQSESKPATPQVQANAPAQSRTSAHTVAALPTPASNPVPAASGDQPPKEGNWFSQLFQKPAETPAQPESKSATPQVQANAPAQSRTGHTVAALPTPASNPVPAVSGDQPAKEGNWFSQLFQKPAEMPAQPESKPADIQSKPVTPQVQASAPARSRTSTRTVAASPASAPNPAPAASGDQPAKEENWLSRTFQNVWASTTPESKPTGQAN